MQVCLVARSGERKKIMAKNKPIHQKQYYMNRILFILKIINKIMNRKPFSLFASTDNKIKNNRRSNYTKFLKKKVKRAARCPNLLNA